MISSDFQKLLICLFVAILLGLVGYGLYCKRKLNSFAGTGKVAEIEAWYFKAALTWATTFGLSIMAIINYI